MDNLEQYIKDNLDEFNNEKLPLNHKEQFLNKLQEQNKKNAGAGKDNEQAANCSKLQSLSGKSKQADQEKKQTSHLAVKIITRTFLSVAAVALLAFFIKNISLNKEESQNTIEVNYSLALEQEEQEIMDLIKNCDAATQEQIIATIKNVSSDETIPISEQLPKELSSQERAKILREYYKQKTNALKNCKLLYAQQIEEDE